MQSTKLSHMPSKPVSAFTSYDLQASAGKLEQLSAGKLYAWKRGAGKVSSKADVVPPTSLSVLGKTSIVKL